MSADSAALELVHARILQAERLAAISQTVSGLAHESRNALQRIQSTVNRLRRRIDGSNGLGVMLDEIENAGDEVKLLFEKVRSYAAPIVLTLQDCSVQTAWREAWTSLPPLKRGDAHLEENMTCADAVCLADVARLRQVFRHIFENSLEASGESAHVLVTCTDATLDDRPAVQVSIRDRGPGFTEDQRRNIFSPFYTTKRDGTGLGMALAKRIIDAHQGSIRTGEDLGEKGAEVVVTLPRTP